MQFKLYQCQTREKTHKNVVCNKEKFIEARNLLDISEHQMDKVISGNLSQDSLHLVCLLLKMTYQYSFSINQFLNKKKKKGRD